MIWRGQILIKNKPFKRIIYNYNLLTDFNWTNIIENNTINLSAANFTATFFAIAKQCMPAKTILVRQRDALWINDGGGGGGGRKKEKK